MRIWSCVIEGQLRAMGKLRLNWKRDCSYTEEAFRSLSSLRPLSSEPLNKEMNKPPSRITSSLLNLLSIDPFPSHSTTATVSTINSTSPPGCSTSSRVVTSAGLNHTSSPISQVSPCTCLKSPLRQGKIPDTSGKRGPSEPLE